MDLNITWFVLLTVLFIAYSVLDGFDLGVGMVHIGIKQDNDRRVLLNSIGPVWDSNEVWLITAGGALFAAFPDVYATVFSGFYIAFMLFLLAIIGRAVSIEFRSKVDSKTWKDIWDITFSISSYLITLLLGVALGNIIVGIPVGADKEFIGNFWTLLNPYSIFLGLTVVVMFRLHGRLFLLFKTEDDLKQIILRKVMLSWIIFIVFYIGLTLWTILAISYSLDNFNANSIWYIVPILSFFAIALIPVFIKQKKYFVSFLMSSLSIALSVVLAGLTIYPNLVISNISNEFSLSIFNASSSNLTLYTMFIIACIGIPLVLVYKFIVYSAFRGKVKLDSSSY